MKSLNAWSSWLFFSVVSSEYMCHFRRCQSLRTVECSRTKAWPFAERRVKRRNLMTWTLAIVYVALLSLIFFTMAAFRPALSQCADGRKVWGWEKNGALRATRKKWPLLRAWAWICWIFKALFWTPSGFYDQINFILLLMLAIANLCLLWCNLTHLNELKDPSSLLNSVKCLYVKEFAEQLFLRCPHPKWHHTFLTATNWNCWISNTVSDSRSFNIFTRFTWFVQLKKMKLQPSLLDFQSSDLLVMQMTPTCLSLSVSYTNTSQKSNEVF